MRITSIVVVSAMFWAATCNSQTQPQASSTNDPHPSTSSSTGAAAKIDPVKEADIRQLLKVMGAGDLGMQTMNQMEKGIRPLLTKSLPPGDYRDQLIELFFEKFHSKINSGGMVDLVVPIYDKYFDDGDIKSLIQLYQTPVGQKLVTTLPKITAESQAAGEQWGRELGRDSMLEVLQEHPELQKAMEAARKNATPQP
ncbi:MAG TPA: DUF2059 domain-containing protein [Terriglobales bacterium]|nr:DUF2059 domain-containing protein [Terriglobales bacterium]